MTQFKCKKCGELNEVERNKEFGITQRTARLIYILIFVPFMLFAISHSKDKEVNSGLAIIVLVSMLYNARNVVK
jgi:hypothetical protein